jgi:CheY-like chemotaxis protein
MNLPKNDAVFNSHTATNQNPCYVALVNANPVLTERIKSELVPPERYAIRNYHWQNLNDCQNTLAYCKEWPPTVWILCADDQNEEIAEYIDYLYRQKHTMILAIDARQIRMPTLWYSYFTLGVSGCLVDHAPDAIKKAIRLLKYGLGFVQLPQGIKRRFRRHKRVYHFSAVELQLFELLLDQQFFSDIDETLKQHLVSLKALLLQKFQADTLNEVFPNIAEQLWQQKRNLAAQETLPKLNISVVSTNRDFAKHIQSVLLCNNQVETVTICASTHEVLSRATRGVEPDLVIVDMTVSTSLAKLQQAFKPLRYFSRKTKRLVVGCNTGLLMTAMPYFKQGANGYIDQAANRQIWDLAIRTVCRQEECFWQLLQTPVTAYTVTGSVSKMVQELGGLFNV